MNIGILSMQKIHNYGSFLQALSLKLQLESRGHNVYFIDILPGRQIVSAERNYTAKKSVLSKFDKYFWKRIENYFFFKKMARIHISDYETYLETAKKLPEKERFDLVIIGSDEVFNATTPSPWGFTQQLFGKIPHADKVVTYAASCGHTTFEDAEKYGITEELREAMQGLSQISVRDQNTECFTIKVSGKQPLLHVDPVFISNFDHFIPPLPKRKPFMLIYAYGNRICDEKEIATIKSYAKKHHLDIVSVGMQQRWCKHNISASAFDLLAYVKAADCIVTDTFHGTVFSIKYNKRFVSLIRESNRNKLGYLLRHFALEFRNVEKIETFANVMDTVVDYTEVNKIIRAEQERSYAYLDMVIRKGN